MLAVIYCFNINFDLLRANLIFAGEGLTGMIRANMESYMSASVPLITSWRRVA